MKYGRRLNPEFSEWMMGLPEGWTQGVSRAERLRMLGNGVVPQQAVLALRALWEMLSDERGAR